jgi:hypothetical protein
MKYTLKAVGHSSRKGMPSVVLDRNYWRERRGITDCAVPTAVDLTIDK